MAKIDQLIATYAESHQNATNKLIHWVCVPLIVFSLFGLLHAIPFPFAEKTMFLNWAGVFFAIAIIYYARLSLAITIGMVLFSIGVLWGNHAIFESVGRDAAQLCYISLAIFVVVWILQFIGHKIEGQKPSFLEDVQYLMIGPAWIMSFIFNKLGIKYSKDS